MSEYEATNLLIRALCHLYDQDEEDGWFQSDGVIDDALPYGYRTQHRHCSVLQNCSAIFSIVQPVKKLTTQICWERCTTLLDYF